jgi:hypothetical protein
MPCDIVEELLMKAERCFRTVQKRSDKKIFSVCALREREGGIDGKRAIES